MGSFWEDYSFPWTGKDTAYVWSRLLHLILRCVAVIGGRDTVNLTELQ